MKKSQDSRDPERGAVAVLLVVLLTTLFGLAALAVDAGFLYTRSRLLQDVADSAVTAGMTDLQGGNMTAAENDATNLANAFATANGYTLTTVDSSTGTNANQLSVHLAWRQPFFFGSVFGFGTKTVNATAVGKIFGTTAPALLALGNCSSGTGLKIGGGSSMTINGNVESNGPLAYNTGPATTTTNGFAESACPGSPTSNGAWNNITGGMGAGGPFPDPFAGVPATLPACDFGTSLAAVTPIPPGNWSAGGVLLPGVYCTLGNLTVAAPADPCNCIQGAGVSFIATGTINIGANGTSALTPNPAMPNGIVAYSQSTNDCTGAPAINVGFQDFTIGGSLYAPSGCINVGANANMNVSGSLVGNEVQLGSNGTWILGSVGGGGGPSGWQMAQ